jgi:predicted permease
MISSSLTPFILLLLGYTLSKHRVAELFNDSRVYVLAVIKLFICPLFTFLIFRTFVHNPLILGMICIGAAMPTGSIIGSICEQFDNNTALCAKVTFATTLLSVVTAPLCILFMRSYL